MLIFGVLMISAVSFADQLVNEINCNVFRSRVTYVAAKVYKRGNSTYAVVSVMKLPNNTVVATYNLPYKDPGTLSLYMTFADTQKNIEFAAFGDDMGGMSHLKVGKRETTLTCSIDPI